LRVQQAAARAKGGRPDRKQTIDEIVTWAQEMTWINISMPLTDK
jgi:hypothetical protein